MNNIKQKYTLTCCVSRALLTTAFISYLTLRQHSSIIIYDQRWEFIKERFKEKRKKTRCRPRFKEKGRKQDLDLAVDQVLRHSFFLLCIPTSVGRRRRYMRQPEYFRVLRVRGASSLCPPPHHLKTAKSLWACRGAVFTPDLTGAPP